MIPQLRHWVAALGAIALIYAAVVMICALDDACALVHM
jgi:hypothetical protein